MKSITGRSEPQQGVVKADYASSDSLNLSFGNMEDVANESQINAANHAEMAAYQIPQPPQAYPNTFVTDNYTPGDWKKGKPGA